MMLSKPEFEQEIERAGHYEVLRSKTNVLTALMVYGGIILAGLVYHVLVK